MFYQNNKISFKHWVIGLCLMTSLLCLWQLTYLTAKAHLAQWLLEHAWQKNQRLTEPLLSSQQITAIKPWPWADNYPVAKLSFERLSTSLLVLNNDSGQALAFGPGLSGATTIEDQGMHIIFGHRDSHFAILAQVLIGDEVSVELVSGLTRRYVINNVFVFNTEKEQLAYLDFPEEGSGELTLITCYPFTGISASTPLRLVVQASEITIKV